MRKFQYISSLPMNEFTHKKSMDNIEINSNDSSYDSEIRMLQQKILILEEKQKNIQTYYQGKINWLKEILSQHLMTKV